MGMSISSVSGGGGSGLNYAHYHGDWDRLPDFGALTPVKTGSVAGFDLSPRTRDDRFGFVFWGSVEIPTAGDYTFFTSSDDGSGLSIDGSLVVDNDGLHGITEASGTVTLPAGPHAIRVTYFDQSGGQHLEVNWQGPGIAKGPIPGTALSTVVAGGGGGGSSGSDGDEGCGLLGLEALLLLLARRRRR
jgi:MYXO-CTERM domain-containing protein